MKRTKRTKRIARALLIRVQVLEVTLTGQGCAVNSRTESGAILESIRLNRRAHLVTATGLERGESCSCPGSSVWMRPAVSSSGPSLYDPGAIGMDACRAGCYQSGSIRA